MKRSIRRALAILALVAASAAIVFLLRPHPVPVETATVTRGPMQTTVDEDGRTRIKERYVISTPLAGRLSRITLKAGAPVEAATTIIATIDPGDPALLDPRVRAQAQARLSAAEAALSQAQATNDRTTAALEQAQTDLRRQQDLRRQNASGQKELDDALSLSAIRTAEHRAATFAVEIARFEVEQARAALMHSSTNEPTPADWRFEVRSPVTGRVLRVLQESSAIVQPGTPLVEVGDPTDLEVQVDVLSTDAVAIHAGSPVLFEHWGGDHPLHGVVRLVEPSAFTKISALGVEEQRVYVLIDFTDHPDARVTLGDGFRVEARIVTWAADNILKAPSGALFREADSWAVFAIADGAARVRPVQIGHRNALDVEVLSGLAEGDTVIAYPSDQVRDGIRVEHMPTR